MVSWPEISTSFVNCSQRERSRITPPPLEQLPWPDLDFLGWRDRRVPETGYLVVADDASVLRGVVLRAGAARKSGGMRMSMCALCLTVHQSGDVVLFAARRAGASGRNGNTVGTYICADLGCSAYVRGSRKPAVPQAFEGLSTAERANRLWVNTTRFIGHVAGVPAG